MTDGKTFYVDMTLPGVFEPFDSVRREDEVQVKRAVLELNKILSALDLIRLVVGQRESQFAERPDESTPVLRGPFHEEVHVLCGIRIPEQYCTGLSDE